MRDSHGVVQWALEDYYGEVTNTVAEVKALEQGLRLCVTRGYQAVDIEVDSKILVLMIQKRGSVPWTVLGELKNIQEHLSKLHYRIMHVIERRILLLIGFLIWVANQGNLGCLS